MTGSLGHGDAERPGGVRYRRFPVKVHFGMCVFDTQSLQLFKDGHSIALTGKARELLTLLINSRPHALSRAELLDRLWSDSVVPDDAPAILIDELRTAIGASGGDPRWIRVVPGVGYAMAPDVEDQTSGAGDGEQWTLTWATRRFSLTPGDNLIGRDPDVAVSIDAQLISRRHARIVVSADGAVIEDLGSKNGTYVGATKLTAPHVLSAGDQIRIGDLTLTVRRTPAQRSAPPLES